MLVKKQGRGKPDGSANATEETQKCVIYVVHASRERIDGNLILATVTIDKRLLSAVKGFRADKSKIDLEMITPYNGGTKEIEATNREKCNSAP